MAKKTVVTPIDDIDGSQGAETVEFGIDGFLYSVDLSAAHAEALRDRLTAYREFGTRLGKLQPRSALTNLRSTPSGRATPSGNRDIRRWAEENGLPIKARWALPTSVIEKYEAAHAFAA
jgi:hypothetical protein